MPADRRRVLVLWIVSLVLHSQAVQSATLLRTAAIERGSSGDSDWLASPAHRRQLLGDTACSDPRWGPLCGRVQALLQLADGHDHKDLERMVGQVHEDGGVLCGSLPVDTWLLLLRPDALGAAAYAPHTLVPYAPEYKVAPEWAPVMELVHARRQQASADAGDADAAEAAAVEAAAAESAQQHVDVHRRILQQKAVQQLQLTAPAGHLRAAASALGGSVVHEPPHKILVGVHFPDVPAAALQRLGVARDGFHPAAAAVADWQTHLEAVVAAQQDGRSAQHLQLCQPELRAPSPYELDVAVCPQDLSEVLYWLSNQAAVHWLAPRPRLRYQNTLASAIVQSSTMKTALDYQTPSAHVFWDAGLDGRSQIVGVGDSGIDMQSCYFADPAVPFMAPTSAAGTNEWVSPTHRKVVYYWGLADESFRDLVGHGTHTAGSVAGFNPAAPDSKATGAAKGARIAFVDLSRTAGGDVNAPQDLEAAYFPRLAARGACIFSDSWGSTSPIYDFQASKLDAWLYANQDCISHFAAGNYGENDNLDSTITSPATAKNTVTVGATKTAAANYVSQTIAHVFSLSVEVKRAGRAPQYLGVRLVRADFGGDGTSLANKGLRVVRAAPGDACAPLEGGASGAYTGAIVLVRRGGCYFSQKMKAGADAGAAAVVIVNDKPGGYFKMDALDNPGAAVGTLPLFAVTRRIGEQLWSYFDTSEAVTGTIERYAQGWPAYEDIASFSSFGPTADGRIKPDIVAPGELVSASSGDADPATASTATCAMGRKAGTSMATPLVAGHTAILRQYFMDGFYPSGAAGGVPHVPSGPLLKAMMLGGACDMQGNTEQYLPLEDSPSMRQGFGRLCLCNALKLGGACTTNVQLVDRVPIASGASHKYCLRSAGGGDVRVTLVWYDYPAPPSAERTLVNDLDLVVTSGGMGGAAFLGNMEGHRDERNTVERVWLRSVPPGGLDITVTANTLSPLTPTQNYTLVVQGAFVDVLASPHNPDPAAAGRPAGGCSADVMAAAAAPAQAAMAAAAATTTAAAAPPRVVDEKGPAQPAATAAAAVAAAAAANASVVAPAPNATATAAPNTSAAAAAAVPPVAAVPVAVQSTAASLPAPQPVVQPAATVPAAAAQPAAAATQPATAATATLPAVPAAAPVPTSQKDLLVNALVGAMTAHQQQQGAPQVALYATPPAGTAPAATAAAATVVAGTAPAATAAAGAALATAPTVTAGAVLASAAPAHGRRLSWAPPAGVAAWLNKVPTTLMCLWRNESARNAAPPAATSDGAAASVRTRHAPTGGWRLAVPAAAVLVSCCALLAAAGLLAVGLQRYSIARTTSLTSAVHKQQSLNKRTGGQAPTPQASLREALLSDPSLIEQLSPTKVASLGLARSLSASAASFSSGSPPSSGPSRTSSMSEPGSPMGAAAAAAAAAAAVAATSLPLPSLRVQVTRQGGGSMQQSPCLPASPATLSPAQSAPLATMLSSPSFSLDMPALRSASVSGSPLRFGSRGASPAAAGVLPSPPGANLGAALQVLVGDFSRHTSAGAAVLAEWPSSRSATPPTAGPGRLQRTSLSFSCGSTPPPSPPLSSSPLAAAAAGVDAAAHTPHQALPRSKSCKEPGAASAGDDRSAPLQGAARASSMAASPVDDAPMARRDQQQ